MYSATWFAARQGGICPHLAAGKEDKEAGGGGSTVARGGGDGGGEGEGKEPHSWAHSLSVPRVGPLSRVRESQSQYLRFLPTVDGDHLFPGA